MDEILDVKDVDGVTHRVSATSALRSLAAALASANPGILNGSSSIVTRSELVDGGLVATVSIAPIQAQA